MNWRNESLRSLLPLSGGFALLLLAAATSAFLSAERREAAFWVRHALEVEVQISRVWATATEAETGQRGYLLTGRPSYVEPFENARRGLEAEIDRLASEVADNPSQVKSLPSLRSSTAAKMAELQRTVDLRATGRGDEALAIVNGDEGKELMSSIQRTLDEMRSEESALLDRRSTRAAWLEGAGEVILLASIVLVVAFGALAVADARRRLVALQDANDRLRNEAAERRAAEGQVRQLQKMEAIGQLTGGIAHDFNNMLAIVLGSLDLARRRLTGTEHPAVLKYIGNATEGATRAAGLTARLLAFSRQQALEPDVVDVNKLAASVSELLRRSIGEAVRIETVLAGGLWKVFVDPAQLESAIVNLAVNARDAMPDGGKLTIETNNAELDERYADAHGEVTAGQYVVVSMTDTGVGMGRDVMERAFDPFYTTKGAGKGTGLGLSQVFGFVKQSKGHVKLYSEVGRGTTAKIYLPRLLGETPGSAEKAGSKCIPEGTPDKAILVVEDESAVRKMTVDAVRELGYAVIDAETPDEALRQLELHPGIVLLFTDIVMPEMNGRELSDIATARKPDLKVLYTTGYTRNSIVHNGVLDPGTAIIQKPFTLEQLALKLRQVLES
jgi:signal transduction histidine kinase